MDKVIEIQDLRKAYQLNQPGRPTFEAVRGISFFVRKGEIFGILGPNGAGKTTTLEIIEGLKEQSSGTVTILGYDNVRDSEKVKQRIGVQLQSADYLPALTLGELLQLFASLYGKKVNTRELLELVDLEDKEHEQVKSLSGGQKQRFTIATTLVNDPAIIFLDEPTTGLDPHARRNLWKLVKDINDKGITVVLTTHYMEEAEYLCHRVAILDHGEILDLDEPQKLIEKTSQTTQVSFLTDQTIDETIFKNVPEIVRVYNEHPKVTLEISSLDHVSKIVDLLRRHKVRFSGFVLKTASLEDVYLNLTGHSYEQ